MAKWEINYRFGLLDYLWWRFMPGVEIELPWPTGNIIVNDQDPRWCDIGGAVWVDLGFSANPNDHYRPWMEESVGRQGWDWNWREGKSIDFLVIKFRKGKEKYATIAAMQWS